MDVQITEKILQQRKVGGHIPCRYSMSKIWAFDCIENKCTSQKRLYEKVLRIFKIVREKYN